ncbi:MAG: tetratricopeptide repeat protein [Bdellovibrionota bacterium]
MISGKLNNFLFISAAIALSACSTTATHVSAKVSVRAVGSTEKKEVGQTPLSITSDQLSGGRKDHGPVFVELTKSGYQPQTIMVTEYANIELDIHQDLVPITGMGDSRTINDAVNRLFEAQRLAKLNRLDEAITTLDAAEQLVPQLSATYEIRGGIRYLQKKYAESLDDYSKALQLDPKNSEAQRMQETLQNLLNKSRGGGG